MRNTTVDFTVGAGETFKPVIRWGSDLLMSKAITALTNAFPAVITSATHGVPSGWDVGVVSVKGMTQINAAAFPPRGRDWHKATTDANTITLDKVNSGDWPVRTGATGWVVYNSPMDLTGATVNMIIRDAPTGGTVLHTLTELAGITVNNTLKTITPTLATAALTWTLGYFDLEVTLSGRVYQILSGTIAITSNGAGVQSVLGVTVVDGV